VDRVVQRIAFAEEEMPCLDEKHRLVVVVVAAAAAAAAKDPLGSVVVARRLDLLEVAADHTSSSCWVAVVVHHFVEADDREGLVHP
jgi:hypothetical protein